MAVWTGQSRSVVIHNPESIYCDFLVVEGKLMVEPGTPIYKVAKALYELMPERWAGGLEPSDVPWHSTSDATQQRLFEAARVAIWTLRPVDDHLRAAGEAVSPNAVFAWTAMIDAALNQYPEGS